MNALTGPEKRKWIWLPAFSVAVFFLFRGTFSIGFRGEDFSWLRWAHATTWRTFLFPEGNGYYRPFASNVPYFFFSQSPGGIPIWELLGLVLAVVGAALFLAPAGPGAWLGLLWLLGPFQAFPAFYLNAFDYRIFPVALLLFLHFIYRKNTGAALACLLLAAFSKEQGMALFVAPLFLFQPQTRAYWLGASAILAAFLFLHLGLFSGAGSPGGFPLAFHAADWLKNFSSMGRSLVLGTNQGSWGVAWHVSAWAALGCIALGLFRQRQWPQLRALVNACAYVFLVHVPLLFLIRFDPVNLGGSFWAFLLFVAAKSGETLPAVELHRAKALLIVVCAVLFGFAVSEIPNIEDYARKDSRSYLNLLEATDPFLEGCDRSNQIVLSNLQQAMGSMARAELALWAFRWRYPLARFYLLLPEGQEAKITDVADPGSWVKRWQIKGHPSIYVQSAGDSYVVTGEGIRGCGIRNGT